MTASAKKRKKIRRPVDRKTLERWLVELNEWRVPSELAKRHAEYGDGKDWIRGAYHAIQAVLR